MEEKITFRRLKTPALIQKKYDDFVSMISKHKLSYKVYELTIKKLSSKKLYTMYVVHESELEIYNKMMDIIQNNIRNFLAALSPDYKREQIVSEDIGKYMWRNYHQTCVQPFAEINYGYCITCHKAQGSSYYDVFVDANDIMKNNKETEMKRCLYTAFSRTVNSLNILF